MNINDLQEWRKANQEARRIKASDLPDSDTQGTIAAPRSPHQFCRYAGPGRGDCEHFVGRPTVMDKITCDEYGIPYGWCDYCWLRQQNADLWERIHILEARP